MTIEPIPDDCLPPPDVIRQLLTPPRLDDQGRIIGGAYHGMTVAEVMAQREMFTRVVGN